MVVFSGVRTTQTLKTETHTSTNCKAGGEHTKRRIEGRQRNNAHRAPLKNKNKTKPQANQPTQSCEQITCTKRLNTEAFSRTKRLKTPGAIFLRRLKTASYARVVGAHVRHESNATTATTRREEQRRVLASKVTRPNDVIDALAA